MSDLALCKAAALACQAVLVFKLTTLIKTIVYLDHLRFFSELLSRRVHAGLHFSQLRLKTRLVSKPARDTLAVVGVLLAVHYNLVDGLTTGTDRPRYKSLLNAHW